MLAVSLFSKYVESDCYEHIRSHCHPLGTIFRATSNLFVTNLLEACQISLVFANLTTVSLASNSRAWCVAIRIAQLQGFYMQSLPCPSIVDCPLTGINNTSKLAID